MGRIGLLGRPPLFTGLSNGRRPQVLARRGEAGRILRSSRRRLNGARTRSHRTLLGHTPSAWAHIGRRPGGSQALARSIRKSQAHTSITGRGEPRIWPTQALSITQLPKDGAPTSSKVLRTTFHPPSSSQAHAPQARTLTPHLPFHVKQAAKGEAVEGGSEPLAHQKSNLLDWRFQGRGNSGGQGRSWVSTM